MTEKRRALPYHKTATTDAAWDGPANEARLKVKDEEAYRAAFAWVDPQGDAETKGAYKFIHHEVGEDGSVGAANTRACSDGIAILNGGRGGANIPDDDRHGVWAHLAAHLKDAGKDVPELSGANSKKRSGSPIIERRLTLQPVELRAGQDGKPNQLVGHAAVFNTPSEIWPGVFERFRPGAFTKTIQESDIRALGNHDSNVLLGRQKNQTLRLSEDSTGLAYEIDLPDTQTARDWYALVDRGDIDGSSYSFIPVKEEWTSNDNGSREDRELIEVRVFDVGPVVFPAFPTTDVAARDMFGGGMDAAALSRIQFKSSRGLPLSSEDRATLKAAMDALGVMLATTEPIRRNHSAGANVDGAGALAIRRARLALHLAQN